MKDELLARLNAALSDNTFVKLSLGKYRGNENLQRILVSWKETPRGLILSQEVRAKRATTTTTVQPADLAELIRARVGSDFFAATVSTTDADWSLDFSRKGDPTLHRHKPTQTQNFIQKHNREKEYLVPPSAPFLYELGISARDGRVKAQHYDKFPKLTSSPRLSMGFSILQNASFEPSTLVRARVTSPLRCTGSSRKYAQFTPILPALSSAPIFAQSPKKPPHGAAFRI